MGHVYYGEYLVWLEYGRTELLRSLGRSYCQWEDDYGVFLPVTSCSLKYLYPAQYDDLIAVETTMQRLTRASVTFTYAISNATTGRLLSTAETSHVFTNADGKIIRTADRLLPEFFSRSICEASQAVESAR